jgi:hypothetical protein
MMMKMVARGRILPVSPVSNLYELIDEIDFSTPKDRRLGYHKAVRLVRSLTGDLEIRVCYFTLRKRSDGSAWWGLCTRPMVFPPEEAEAIAKGIRELMGRSGNVSS